MLEGYADFLKIVSSFSAFLLVRLWELQWRLVVSRQQPCCQGAESTFTLAACFLPAYPFFSGCTLLLPFSGVPQLFLSSRLVS